MATKYVLYKSKTNAKSWYGDAVSIPLVNTSLGASWAKFVGNSAGIIASMVESKTERKINLVSTYSCETAYADYPKKRIVISNKLLIGDLSGLHLDSDPKLSRYELLGAIMGIIVHEVGHFVYSNDFNCDLRVFAEYIQDRTTRAISARLASNLGNVIEDIYIENLIRLNFPNLAWTLDEINKLLLSEKSFAEMVRRAASFTQHTDIGELINLALYTKVSNHSAVKLGLSPLAAKIWDIAQSAKRAETLKNRLDITLALYEAIAPEKSSVKPVKDILEDILDSLDNDTDSLDSLSDDSDTDSLESSDTDDSDSTESDDTDDTESSSDDFDDNDNVSNPSDFDEDSDPFADFDFDLPDLGESEEDHKDLPDWDVEKIDFGTNALPVLVDGIAVKECLIDAGYGEIKPIEVDLRYAKLAQLAMARTAQQNWQGTARNSGRKFGDLTRIIQDQKIFATRHISEPFQPIEIVILVDCSGSMRPTKLYNALSAAIGATNALITARCTVSVYGHSTPRTTNESYEVSIYPFKRVGDPYSTLQTNAAKFYSNPYLCCNNRDGTAIRYMRSKFTSNRAKHLIVISDGQPAAHNYDNGVSDTRDAVNALRKSGINVTSISIDHSAFRVNDSIYGAAHNVNNTDVNVLDNLLRNLFNQ